MKHIHHYFRVLSEARLCHMDGSQGRGPDQPEPQKVETKSEQPEGEAFMKMEDADSSKSVGKKAQDAMDKRTGDLGKVLEDMNELPKSNDAVPEVAVPPASEGKARKPRGNAEKRQKIRDADSTPTPDIAKSVDVPPGPEAPASPSPSIDPINTPKAKTVSPESSVAPSTVAPPEATDVAANPPQAPNAVPVPPEPAPVAEPGVAGAAGNDVVGGAAEQKPAEGQAADAGQNGKPGEKPEDPKTESPKNKEEKKEVVDDAKKAAEGAKDAAPKGPTEKGDRVTASLDNLKKAAGGKDFGAFLVALKEVMDSIRAIFKPETKKDDAKDAKNAPGAGSENKGDQQSSGPTEAGNKPVENGETSADRKNQLRKEVSEAGSVKEFNIVKEQQKQDSEGTIQKEEDEIQKLDDANDVMERQTRTLERQIPTGKKLSREQQKAKSQLEDDIRDLKVNIDANKKHIENNKNDIQEHANEQKKIVEDIQIVEDMVKEVTNEKDAAEKALTEMRNTKDLTNNQDMKTLLDGVSVDVDTSKISISVTVTEEGRAALDNLAKQAGVSTEDVFGEGGVVKNMDKFKQTLVSVVADIGNKAKETKKA